MNEFTRNRVEDTRVPDKSSEADFRGIHARLAKSDATVSDFGTEKIAKFRLRAGDNRDAMIAGVRGEAARRAQLTIVEAPKVEREAEVSAYANPLEDPRLAIFKAQYDLLSVKDRTCKGKVRTWPEVAKAIPNMPDFLAGLSTLTKAQPYFLNEKGQLVVGDGCAEPSRLTFGLNYHESRSAQTRISYLDDEGELVVVTGDDIKIPSDAKILSEKGLVTREEYNRVNKGQFDKANWIWIESGKNPSVASDACRGGGGANSSERIDTRSRGVLRVNLNFGS